MSKKFEAELGINNKNFVQGLAEAEGGIGKFGKALGLATVAIGAAGAVFTAMIGWLKDTELGAEAVNITMGVTKQLFTDLMAGQGFHIKEAIKNAQIQTKINKENIEEGWVVKKMQTELNKLIVAASNQTLSLAEKKELLTKAMEKEHELKQYLLKDAIEERKAAWDFLQVNKQSITAYKAFVTAAERVLEIEGMDSRRLMSQYSGVMEQQAQRARDLVDAFTPLPKILEDVNERLQNPINYQSLGKAARGNMKGLPGFEKPGMEGIQNAPGQAAEAIKEFSSMQEAIMNLSATFSTFFSDVNLGFQGMIAGIITGLKRLVMELMSKAVFLTILSVITGGGLPTLNMFKNLLLGKDWGTILGGRLAGGSAKAVGSAPMSGSVEFVLKGKDLYGSVNRYSQELGYGT